MPAAGWDCPVQGDMPLHARQHQRADGPHLVDLRIAERGLRFVAEEVDRQQPGAGLFGNDGQPLAQAVAAVDLGAVAHRDFARVPVQQRHPVMRQMIARGLEALVEPVERFAVDLPALTRPVCHADAAERVQGRGSIVEQPVHSPPRGREPAVQLLQALRPKGIRADAADQARQCRFGSAVAGYGIGAGLRVLDGDELHVHAGPHRGGHTRLFGQFNVEELEDTASYAPFRISLPSSGVWARTHDS